MERLCNGIQKKPSMAEMRRYARQQFPYDEHIQENEVITAWWKKLEGLKDAGHLAGMVGHYTQTFAYVLTIL